VNVRIQLPLRNSLAAGLCLVAGLLAAGCSAAPPGARYNSPAAGPVPTHYTATTAPTDFASFPQPDTYNGLGNSVYTQVQKPQTGTAPGGFHFTVKPDMVFWLNCIGRGTALVSSPGIALKWSVPCNDGSSPRGINFAPKASAVGHVAFVLVTSTRGSKWEIRIDDYAPKGVHPAPDRIPSRTTTTTTTTR
jgi:hypothetical protein